jgi:hypothetical protein
VADRDEEALHRELAVASSTRLRMRTPVTPVSSPSTSSTAWFHTSSILPSLARLNSLSCRIFSARSLSRRCTR